MLNRAVVDNKTDEAGRSRGPSLHTGSKTGMVKIFKCAERSRSSMMDVEDEHNHMRPAFGLRYRIGKPGTPAAE